MLLKRAREGQQCSLTSLATMLTLSPFLEVETFLVPESTLRSFQDEKGRPLVAGHQSSAGI